MGEPLALGDMHFGIPAKIPAKSPALRRIGRLCASVSPPSSHFHSDAAHAEILPFSANGGGLLKRNLYIRSSTADAGGAGLRAFGQGLLD
jgi:hypothetical protein